MSGFTMEDAEILLDLLRTEMERPSATIAELAQLAGTWDSVTLVSILFETELRFGVVFSAAQMERVDGIQSLVTIIIEARRSAKKGLSVACLTGP